MTLNARQEKFVHEYIKLGNATQAAINAGYSKKYANTNASKLLQNTTIVESIREQTEQIRNQNILDASQVLEKLSEIAMLKPKNIVSKAVDNKTGKVKKDVTYTIVPETADQVKALELLGKRYALFTDKVQQQTSANIEIDIGGWEDET